MFFKIAAAEPGGQVGPMTDSSDDACDAEAEIRSFCAPFGATDDVGSSRKSSIAADDEQ